MERRRSHGQKPEHPPHGRAGFTFVELLVSVGIMSMILAILASVTIYMRRSVEATNHYLLETNNGNRLLDYVGRDLNRAVRVGQLAGASYSDFKTGASFAVSETNILTINLPDFYASNNPTNLAGSAFRTSRNARETLGPGGVVPWKDAVRTQGTVLLPRFAPLSGSDEIQVRYYRGVRSAQDRTVCYFRREHSAVTGIPLADPVEVAEQVSVGSSMTALILTGFNEGRLFRVQSNFIPRYRRAGATAAGTLQMREVRVHNPRRD